MNVVFLVNVVYEETGLLDSQFVSQVWRLDKPSQLRGRIEKQIKILEESGVQGKRCVIQQVITLP